MNKLPEYFVIKKDESNPLWRKYLDWLRVSFSVPHLSGKSEYYGYCRIEYCHASSNLTTFTNESAKLITLEEWNEAVNGFVLPEKWCIQCNKDNYQIIYEWLRNNKQTKSNYISLGGSDINTKVHYPTFQYSPYGLNFHQSDNCQPNYTEITFEQFKKYVLKMEEREIIGYKLKEGCEQYKNAIKALGSSMLFPNEMEYLTVEKNTETIPNLQKAGVLDLWFEPVYKEEFKVGDYIYSLDSSADYKQDVVYKIETFEDLDNKKNVLVACKGDNNRLATKNKCYFRKATKEEILQHLTKEAQSKGFVVGAKVTHTNGKYPKTEDIIIGYDIDDNNELRLIAGSHALKSYIYYSNCTLYKEPSFNYDNLNVENKITYMRTKESNKFENLKKLQRIANYVNGDWVADFNNGNLKYSICKEGDVVNCVYTYFVDRGVPYFKSHDIALKVIQDNPELMKEIFE